LWTRLRLRSHRTRFSTNLRLRSLLWNYYATLLWLCLWSCWRCDAFTVRLLLRSHDRTFGSNRTNGTFNSLRLALLNTTRLFRYSRLLFDSTWLFHGSRLLNSTRLLHRLLPLCCLRRCTAVLSLTLVSHLELLSPRALGCRVHTHRLRQIRTERRRCRRTAGNHCRVA
jgi:hypothetical protein